MTARRGNKEGSILKREDGRWMARLSLPSGARKAFYGRTRAEVVQKLQEGQEKVKGGLPLPRERLTRRPVP